MRDIDLIRQFNVTNATLPIQGGQGNSTNLMVMRVDNDIYQKTVAYFENIDVSNNYGFYPPLLITGNLRSTFSINRLI